MTGYSLRRQETFKPFQCTFIHKRMCKREMQLEASSDSQYDVTSYSSATSGSAEHPLTQCDLFSDLEKSDSSQEEEKLYSVFYCIPLISPYKGQDFETEGLHYWVWVGYVCWWITVAPHQSVEASMTSKLYCLYKTFVKNFKMTN